MSGRTGRRRPRVGHIGFVNCHPLLWGLGRTGELINLELTVDTPDRLSASLVAGDLDMGPISLMEFLRHADDLVALPDIAIGSDGEVMSCLLVSDRPLDRLDGAPVALCGTSRTTVRLAQLILSELVGVAPSYFVSRADVPTMLDEAAAVVVIGDPALEVARLRKDRPDLVVHDLGRMWRDWTGLPFVFALFAARRDYAEREPELTRSFQQALVAARDLALDEIDLVCERAARWESQTAPDLKRYYTTALDYSLGERQLAGISEFARLVAKASAEFPGDVRVRLLEPLLQEA